MGKSNAGNVFGKVADRIAGSRYDVRFDTHAHQGEIFAKVWRCAAHERWKKEIAITREPRWLWRNGDSNLRSQSGWLPAASCVESSYETKDGRR